MLTAFFIMTRTKHGKQYDRWYSTKTNCTKKKRHFDFSFEEYKAIANRPCTYCNYVGDQTNGIDRVDSSIGYTKDNSVPCCKVCNMAKNTLTVEQFKDWLRRCYHKMILGE